MSTDHERPSTRLRAPRAWIPRLAAVLAIQLGLVGVAVAPQLTARVSGEEYLLRVQPYDPIDPFRGAYVDLDYPDLGLGDGTGGYQGDATTVFISLVERDGVWVARTVSDSRPDAAPYLTCDHHGWRLSCGIESLFLPQDQAAAYQELLGSDQAVARVRIDGRGHAALMGVERR